MLDPESKKKEGGRKAAITDRVASAVRRAQEEVSSEEPQTDDCIDMPVSEMPSAPESPIDRMQWTSTSENFSETPTRL